MKTLKDVKVGETATVARLHGEGRQKGRFDLNKIKNLQHVEFDLNAILMAISNSKNYKHLSNEFGCGNSADMFLRILKSDGFWRRSIQKHLTY